MTEDQSQDSSKACHDRLLTCDHRSRVEVAGSTRAQCKSDGAIGSGLPGKSRRLTSGHGIATGHGRRVRSGA